VAAGIYNMFRGGNQHTPIGGTTQEEAAEMLNVSPRLIQHASKVQNEGIPELAEKVQSGVAAVSTASSHLLTSHRPGTIFGNNRRALLTETFIHFEPTNRQLFSHSSIPAAGE